MTAEGRNSGARGDVTCWATARETSFRATDTEATIEELLGTIDLYSVRANRL
jgi:hypothetical protein